MTTQKIEQVLKHFLSKAQWAEIKDLYLDLYQDCEQNFKQVFAYLHQEINILLEALNRRTVTSRYYLADDSRRLISIIEDLETLNRDISPYGESITIDAPYEKIIEEVQKFLSPFRGSQIPESFNKVSIIYYEPIFSTDSKKISVKTTRQNLDLQVIGEWAFSIVTRYKDPVYNKYYAVKRLKKWSSEREKQRFKKEFEVLQSLNFPYILEVYSFDNEKNCYVMEYCDTSLSKYISENNSKLQFASRKRIAQQFLYALNYLHLKWVLHRDVSYNNILIKKYEWAVTIKLSDFWLIKNEWSDFTKTDTEIKWTIIDPSLTSFKDYDLVNEIYCVGFIINFIFTGKKNFNSDETNLSKIVEGCTNSNTKKRYRSITEIINAVEQLAD